MIRHSTKNPARHENTVVTKPPNSGPIAAAIAPAAPTSAKTLARSLPTKLPWISDCIAGR